ncbi:hypothetical protein CHARACLAT_022978, partial [Characodon lateralis]|nr:hypothetical protein [Characodon lateralis]
MPSVCCAVGCDNKKGDPNISFYRLLKEEERRQRWLSAIRRANWTATASSRLCSAHFVSCAKSQNPLSPDYVPTIFPHLSSPNKRKRIYQMARFEHTQALKRKRAVVDADRGETGKAEDRQEVDGNDQQDGGEDRQEVPAPPVSLQLSYSFFQVFVFLEPTTTPTQSFYHPKEQPPAAAEPLPVSGSIHSPVAGADRLCPCDENTAVCDINCCCDRECNEEVALFTSCSISAVRSGSKRLCSQDVAQYTLRTTVDGYSELQSSVQKETNYDILCIQAQN